MSTEPTIIKVCFLGNYECLRDIQRLRLLQHLIPEVLTNGQGRFHVQSATADELRKLDLHSGGGNQPRNGVRVELDQHVDLAVGNEVVSEDGPEESQTLDVMLAAEAFDLLGTERESFEDDFF